MLHDGLIKPMPGVGSGPSLAQSWAMAKDMLSAEFVLRPAKFHNGDPVTAEDVKFSFERYRGGAAKVLKDAVKEIQTPAPNRVKFVFKEPWPDFGAFYGTFVASAGWVVPKKYFERVGEEGYRKAPVGAGPYKFVSFNPGVELVVEAFDGYWRKTPVHQEDRLPQPARRDHPRRRAQERRGGPGHAADRADRAGHQAHAGHAPGRAAARHLLARLPGSVGSEVALGRPARAAGRQPRAGPAGAERGGDPRALAAHRQHRPA